MASVAAEEEEVGGEAGEEEEGKEKERREEKKFRLISYEVQQNSEASVGQNHRPFVLLDAVELKFVQQQLGGQEGQLEGKGGRELVSCSLKLTTLFLGHGFGVYAYCASEFKFKEMVNYLRGVHREVLSSLL